MIKVSAVQHLNTWSPIVDAVWRSFEGMAFLDKRTTGVGFKSLKTLTTSSPLTLLPVCGLRCGLSALSCSKDHTCLLPHFPPVMVMDSYSFGTVSPNKPFLYKLPWYGVLSQQ